VAARPRRPAPDPGCGVDGAEIDIHVLFICTQTNTLCLFVCLFGCLYVCLVVCLFGCLFVCFLVCFFVCLIVSHIIMVDIPQSGHHIIIILNHILS
jgi:hypothetical protein